MAISFQQVSFQYPGQGGRPGGKVAGVEAIDLEIAEGELLAVIGPSGSGKSTLLKLLAGFLEPDQGTIAVDGRAQKGLPPHRRELGLVFQSYALFQHMSALDNVAYPLKVRGLGKAARRARARDALARVGLADWAERQPATLSGGQQQRVALARALVFQPRALLLDEPLSALDASLRAEMRDEIRRVQQEAGIATLHVTHDQEEALSIADRVAVMLDGRLIQVADPQTLYDNPRDRRVAAFVGQANLWSGRVVARDMVQTEIGDLRCATGETTVGAPVTVLVRPERIEVMPAGTGADSPPNLFSGALDHDRFLGALRRYDLAVEGGVIRGETSFRGPLQAVSIPPDAIRLLPPGDGASPPPSPQGEAT